MTSNGSSQARCPFGGNSTASLSQQDKPADSAPADAGNLAGLSVSFPPKDYLAFKDEAYRIDLRLDRITLDDIFEIDEDYEADMARKAHILATRPTEMLLPGVPGVSFSHDLPLIKSLTKVLHLTKAQNLLVQMWPAATHYKRVVVLSSVLIA